MQSKSNQEKDDMNMLRLDDEYEEDNQSDISRNNQKKGNKITREYLYTPDESGADFVSQATLTNLNNSSLYSNNKFKKQYLPTFQELNTDKSRNNIHKIGGLAIVRKQSTIESFSSENQSSLVQLSSPKSSLNRPISLLQLQPRQYSHQEPKQIYSSNNLIQQHDKQNQELWLNDMNDTRNSFNKSPKQAIENKTAIQPGVFSYRKSVTQQDFKSRKSILKNSKITVLSDNSASNNGLLSNKPFDLKIQKMIKETEADLEDGLSLSEELQESEESSIKDLGVALDEEECKMPMFRQYSKKQQNYMVESDDIPLSLKLSTKGVQEYLQPPSVQYSDQSKTKLTQLINDPLRADSPIRSQLWRKKKVDQLSQKIDAERNISSKLPHLSKDRRRSKRIITNQQGKLLFEEHQHDYTNKKLDVNFYEIAFNDKNNK